MLRAVALTALLGGLAATLVGSAQAQSVGDCAVWQANARNVNWSDPPRTFANGAIRLVVLDTEEPAAAAFHLMVLLPDPHDGYQTCALISAGPERSGFGGLSLADARASYDPAQGLIVKIPAQSFADGIVAGGALTVIINQATGDVVAR